MENVFIGRQPIYNRNLEVYAYELLFRDGNANRAEIDDADLATSELIVSSLTEFGLSNLVGDKLAFVNLTHSFVTGKLALPESSRYLVLEVLEDIEIDEDVLNGIQLLKQQGYKIALDDFVYHEHLQPLVETADIIKIDLLALTRIQLSQHVKTLREHPVKLLAEKVETQEEFDFCKELDFDYFQGYFFCTPKIIKAQRIPSNRLSLLNLLSRLLDPETSIEDIEQIISQDVTLSLRLLRYINSSHYSFGSKIDSIKNAIMLLGMHTIRSLATLILATTIDNKPFELFITALIRAHMCEQMAENIDKKLKPSFFMVGLLSVIDAMLDQPMDVILEKLPLTNEVCAALTEYKGDMGNALRCVIAYERGEWAQTANPFVSTDEIREIYLKAIYWCRAFTDTLAQLQAA